MQVAGTIYTTAAIAPVQSVMATRSDGTVLVVLDESLTAEQVAEVVVRIERQQLPSAGAA